MGSERKLRNTTLNQITMTAQQLKAFITKVQADNSLQEQLKAEDADPVAIAKAAGFSISTEDLDTYRQNLNLSNNELESAAGGGEPCVGGLSYCLTVSAATVLACPPITIHPG